MIDNLLYFDVEYANSKNKSICQMGLMIEERDTQEPVYPELELYVNPEDNFDVNCVNVHHISSETVKDALPFDKLWPQIEKYFVNSVVVGHNISSSDLDALCKDLVRYNIAIPELWYLDTLEIARDYIKPIDIADYKLSTLCEYFDVYMGEEHNAFDDACACADLLRTMQSVFDIDLDDYVKHYEFNKEFEFSPYVCALGMARELNLLIGEVNGILADGIISELESNRLKNWYEAHKDFVANSEYKKIMDVFADILNDGVVTVEETQKLKQELIVITQDLSSSMETKATQLLQGMINGITSDQEISEGEVLSLQRWLYENDYLMGHYPYDKIKDAIDGVLEDKIITEEEKNYLTSLFNELFNPIKEAIKETIVFENNEFCLSGEFVHGTKDAVEKFIVSKGGIVNKSVRKKTNYVVVGGNGSNAYSNVNYGTKVKKALELGVSVITEKQLYGEV